MESFHKPPITALLTKAQILAPLTKVLISVILTMDQSMFQPFKIKKIR
jgi:hypothetical protein